MRKLYLYISLIPFFLFSQTATLEVDTSQLRIGEHFRLKIKVHDVQLDSVLWPQNVQILENFDLIDQLPSSLYLEGDTYAYKEYIFTSFDTGRFVIDSIPIMYGLKDSLFTESLAIHYLATPIDTTNHFFDIKPPKKIPFLIKELLRFIPFIILFLVILFSILIYLKYLKKRNLKNLPVKIPSIPIDIYFLDKLDSLEKKSYLTQNRHKDFYTELSEIFRGYLEMRFNIPALESSTYDLKVLLKSQSIKEKWLSDFFRNNDLVKFAKGIPSEKDRIYKIHVFFIYLI